MASSRSGSGMKILWIPGRKRHDRKGIYKPTNKEVNKNYLQPRRNEMWSLGGANEQRKIINVSAQDDIASSSAAHMIDPLCVAAGATTATTIAANAVKDNPSDDNANLDESQKEKIVDKEILKNGDLTPSPGNNTDNIDIDADDQAYHNAGTIRFRNKKTGSNNTDLDLDSIEHLDFDEEDGKKNDDPQLDDDIDSVSMQRIRSANVPSRRRRKSRKKNKNLDEPQKKDDKLVDCLYVGLMCCECSIS